jgi:hypothetical protein
MVSERNLSRIHETMASSERGERVAKSFTASSLWWWMVDCLFMAAERIRECGDDLTERKTGGVEEQRYLDHHSASFFYSSSSWEVVRWGKRGVRCGIK